MSDYKTFNSLGIPVHHNRQLLINYSKAEEQHPALYYLTYSGGTQYYNIDLDYIRIEANNVIEAHVIFRDYLNSNLKMKHTADAYALLFDDHEPYFDLDDHDLSQICVRNIDEYEHSGPSTDTFHLHRLSNPSVTLRL